jgi:IclR family acetate operon transcriptional repressor
MSPRSSTRSSTHSSAATPPSTQARSRPASRATLESANHTGPQSVGRVVALLEHLVGHTQGATLAELAQATSAPKTSLVGLLQALVHERCVDRNSVGRYVLGERIFALALRASAGHDLTSRARPFLQDLVDETGETAVLGVIDPSADLVLYVDKVEGTHPLRYTVHVGERREMHCTAMGKALLAHCAQAQVDRVLSVPKFAKFTPSTVTSPRRLASELAQIRREGIARSINQRIDGIAACAAPVFGLGQQLLGAILVAGPTERFEAQRGLIETQIKRHAQALSMALGARS